MSKHHRKRAGRRSSAGRDDGMVELGSGLVQASPEAVIRAMSGLPPDLGWPDLAKNVVPILPRLRPMPPIAGEPFRVTLPPGIPTGFGVDIGPALLVVSESLLASWPIGPAELVATGLDNLRRLVRRLRPRDLLEDVIDTVPVRILQTGVGCASTLVLVPDELQRLFGTHPQCLIAPMRDLLISLPADTDRALVAWLNAEFSAMDPNGLALDAFLLEAGGLRYEVLRPGVARAAM
jgi:hypothetical protein